MIRHTMLAHAGAPFRRAWRIPLLGWMAVVVTTLLATGMVAAPTPPTRQVVSPLASPAAAPAPPDLALTTELTQTLLVPAVFTGPDTRYLPLVYRQPILFKDPVPGDGASGQSPNTFLAWDVTADLDLPAPITYDIYLDFSDREPTTLLVAGRSARHYDPYTLATDTRYTWRVVATGADGRQMRGPTWTFRTEPFALDPDVDARIYIPAGWFTMGCDRANPAEFPCRTDVFHGEEPLHEVYLDAYLIDKYEVTNGEYKECVDAGACQRPRRLNSHQRSNYYGNSAYADFPVLYVSMWDAQRFCAWDDGGRLPTEAEWEKAARGPFDRRVWPWGDEPHSCSRMNYTDTSVRPWNVCVNDTTRVGSYPNGASPYGLMDMSGNVFEWVADKYDVFYYYYSPAVNPQGPDRSRIMRDRPPFGLYYTIRGGSYRPNWYYARIAHRHWGHHGDSNEDDSPFYRNDQVGFRCAYSP